MEIQNHKKPRKINTAFHILNRSYAETLYGHKFKSYLKGCFKWITSSVDKVLLLVCVCVSERANE